MLACNLKLQSDIDPVIQERIRAFMTETLPGIDNPHYKPLAQIARIVSFLHIHPYTGHVVRCTKPEGEMYKVVPVRGGNECTEAGVFFLQVFPEGIMFHALPIRQKTHR